MRNLLAIPALLLASTVSAEPFEECPANAFIIQGSSPGTFTVDLNSGGFQYASWMGLQRSLNAVGYNSNDNYMYGWSYQHGDMVRIHNNYKVEVLDVKNLPSKDLHTGDVASVNNTYYAYRKDVGIVSVSLDPLSQDYLTMKTIEGTENFNVSITDWAILPNTTLAYAVDNRTGELLEIDVTVGTSRVLGETGVTGFFGGAYFDSDNNLYVSRNNDGHIYRVSLDSGSYKAELFTYGPASNFNDGASCATSTRSVLNDLTFDFGDAPDSYGTNLASDGARHEATRENRFVLGTQFDAESDASAYPLSDDKNGQINDDDGVQFATNITEGTNAIAKVTTNNGGYINAWIDLDQNGIFDGNDHVGQDIKLEPGTRFAHLPIPAGVVGGDTWARFRYTSTPGVGPTGSAPDGEVEDYLVNVKAAEVTVTSYPSNSGLTTIAFEDNWPYEGDYDLNDMVVQMKTAVSRTSTGITQVAMKGQVTAVGAAYHNGFAVRLPGVKRDQVDVENIKYEINGREVAFKPLEAGREEAIFIVSYNVFNYVASGNHCTFYRTEEGCGSDIQLSFSATIPMKEPVDADLKGVFDPFLFATPGAWHGGHFVEAPGRSYEIHLKNQAPTEAFDMALLDLGGDDATNPAINHYFLTEKGMPWAMEIGTDWDHPIEYTDISYAYPDFANWSTSNGLLNQDWYISTNANVPLLFDN